MHDLTFWLVFLSAAIALNLSPGPDMIYIISRTSAYGRKVGFASVLGVCSGALFHVFAAALGLSAILATSALAFSIVKYIGAAYLIYLGVKMIFTSGSSFHTLHLPRTSISFAQAFRQGVLIDVLNPKVALFFMAFLPQFVRPEMGSTPWQIMGLGFLVVCVSIVVESVFVLAAAKISYFLQRNQSASVWLDRVFGSVLIALGIRLALSEHQA